MRKQLLKDHNFLNNSPIFIIESSTLIYLLFKKQCIQYISIWKIVLDLVKSTWHHNFMAGCGSPGGVLPMWWVIHMCRGFDPLFSLWQDRARSFWGVFSHPPTQKRSFGYKSLQNSIFLAPKYHFSLDLFGSNFQWPAAHPQQFSDRVPPPGAGPCCAQTHAAFEVGLSIDQGQGVYSGRGGTAYVEVTMMYRSNGSLLGTPESLHMGTLLAKCP